MDVKTNQEIIKQYETREAVKRLLKPLVSQKKAERDEKGIGFVDTLSVFAIAIAASFIAGAVLLSCSDAHAEIEVDLSIIAQIESSNNPEAYNDSSKARGLYQITPICLKDYNEYHEIDYMGEDLFNPEVNEKVAKWYFFQRIPQLLNYYKQDLTLDNVLVAYNCGIKCVIDDRRPTETSKYITKYYKLLQGK